MHESLQLKTRLEAVDSLDSIQEEASTVQAKGVPLRTDLAVPAQGPVHRKGIEIDENEKRQLLAAISPIPRPQKSMKRDQCCSSEVTNEDACIHFDVEGVNTVDDRELEERRFKKRKDNPSDERCDELAEFKNKFGHCNVPHNFAENPTLGAWCNQMRCACNKPTEGQQPDTAIISGETIDRLEEIGFAWNVIFPSLKRTFDSRFQELTEYKIKYGHCDVPQRYPVDPSLGRWCMTLRSAYNQLQKGLPPRMALSGEQITRLVQIGFKWKINITSWNAAFEKRIEDMIEFKNEFGHCDVPVRYTENPSLGQWCSKLRRAYDQLQKGQKPCRDMSGDRCERLEALGFKWKVPSKSYQWRPGPL